MSIIENYPPCVVNVLMNHIGTHDTERAITRLAGESAQGKDRSWQHSHNQLSDYDYLKGVSMMKLASLIQYTLPGVPSLYYGDEAGMQGMKDPFNRACFPWDNINKELYRWYKRLGEIRRGCKAFREGSFEPLYAADRVVAYVRRSNENSVLTAVNNSEQEIHIPVGEEWDNSYSFFEFSSKNGILTLPPYQFALLSK